MFIEPHLKRERLGWIEVICGSMFSGKTEELIRRLKRARIANLKVEIFKPAIDTRYDEQNVVSHDEKFIVSTPVNNSLNILLLSEGVDVVGIDFQGNPFGPIPTLMATAEYITKVHAICMQCGNIASRSYRKVNNNAQVLLGEKEEYEARCRTCFLKDS